MVPKTSKTVVSTQKIVSSNFGFSYPFFHFFHPFYSDLARSKAPLNIFILKKKIFLCWLFQIHNRLTVRIWLLTFPQVSKAIRGEKEEEDTEPDSSAPENGETKPESPTSLDETVREPNNR